MRVEDAHPAIVSKREFRSVKRLLGSRAPKRVHPRRSASPYLLSGLLRCETCGKAMTAAEAKSGKYTWWTMDGKSCGSGGLGRRAALTRISLDRQAVLGQSPRLLSLYGIV